MISKNFISVVGIWAILGAGVAGAQPDNDLCSDARVVRPEDLPYEDVSDNTLATDTRDNSESPRFGGGGGLDVWWAFQPAESGSYRVTAFGFDTAIGIFEEPCGTGLEVDALDGFAGPENGVFALDEATTYSMLVEGYSASDVGQVRFSVTGPLPDPEPNDRCPQAIEVTSSELPFDHVGVDIRGNEDLARRSDRYSGPDVYYRFTAGSAAVYRFHVTGLTEGFNPAILALREIGGVPCENLQDFTGSLSGSTADDTGPVGSGEGEGIEELLVFVKAGEEMVLIVDSVDPYGGEFDLLIEGTLLPTPTPLPSAGEVADAVLGREDATDRLDINEDTVVDSGDVVLGEDD